MDRTTLDTIRALIVELEGAFQKDRPKVFQVLEQLKDLCQYQPLATQKLSLLEAVLLDYQSTLDDVFAASGAVISALRLPEKTVDSV